MTLPRLIIDDAIPYLPQSIHDSFDCQYMPGEKIEHRHLAEADGLLVRTRTKCNAALLAGTPVRFIATGTIGLDHIDTQWCTSQGIHWQNAPGCNAPAVAQYVWTALLTLGFNPTTQTLGIIGCGNVGSRVAQWARLLGTRIIVCDPPRQEAGHTDYDYTDLDTLLAQADAVTIHTPLTHPGPDINHPTHHLLQLPQLDLLKNGAILINAARGGTVNEEDLRLIAPLKKLRIAIDTWEGEPTVNPATVRLADIATFHIAGYSQQGKERASRAIIEGLNSHFGTNIPCSHLASPYTPPATLTPQEILQSYPIMADDHAMRSHAMTTEGFEHARNSYKLRQEI